MRDSRRLDGSVRDRIALASPERVFLEWRSNRDGWWRTGFWFGWRERLWEGFEAPQLNSSDLTEQFCPLPRNRLRLKLESRESSPVTACRLRPEVIGRKKSGEVCSAVLARH
jgi:hypothetical protein